MTRLVSRASTHTLTHLINPTLSRSHHLNVLLTLSLPVHALEVVPVTVIPRPAQQHLPMLTNIFIPITIPILIHPYIHKPMPIAILLPKSVLTPTPVAPTPIRTRTHLTVGISSCDWRTITVCIYLLCQHHCARITVCARTSICMCVCSNVCAFERRNVYLLICAWFSTGACTFMITR